jgi:hypothetical protein
MKDVDIEEKEIKNQINIYIKKCKPKYFKKEDIKEIIELMESINKHIDKSRIERNIENDVLKNKNNLLNSKLEIIKINLENNMNVQGILVYLDNLKNDENLIVRIFLKTYLYIFYILFYLLTIFNNKKIIKKIKQGG